MNGTQRGRDPLAPLPRWNRRQPRHSFRLALLIESLVSKRSVYKENFRSTAVAGAVAWPMLPAGDASRRTQENHAQSVCSYWRYGTHQVAWFVTEISESAVPRQCILWTVTPEAHGDMGNLNNLRRHAGSNLSHYETVGAKSVQTPHRFGRSMG